MYIWFIYSEFTLCKLLVYSSVYRYVDYCELAVPFAWGDCMCLVPVRIINVVMGYYYSCTDNAQAKHTFGITMSCVWIHFMCYNYNKPLVCMCLELYTEVYIYILATHHQEQVNYILYYCTFLWLHNNIIDTQCIYGLPLTMHNPCTGRRKICFTQETYIQKKSCKVLRN